jgi:hypothetical protein
MPRKILRLANALDRTGLSRSTSYQRVTEGRFPGRYRCAIAIPRVVIQRRPRGPNWTENAEIAQARVGFASTHKPLQTKWI